MSKYRLFAIVLTVSAIASTSVSAQIVEARKLKQAADGWERELKRAESVEQHVRVGEGALLTFEEALTATRFSAADRLAQTAVDAANEARNLRLRQEALACKHAVVTSRREFDALQQAGAALVGNPRDSAANPTVGKYLCFKQRNW